MEWLNYHHLYYFWVVAREGSIARATRKLRLAEPTISSQIRRLEHVLGEALFERTGRRLVMTDCGRLAFDYAESIFSLGQEFVATLKGRAGATPARLHVGVADVLPKAIVASLLRPALEAKVPFRLVCREDKSVDEFLGQLDAHALDLVLADAPSPPGRAKVINHFLGDTGTTVFGVDALARGLRGNFPGSLHRAPFLVAGFQSGHRRALEGWFDRNGIRPNVVAEVDDISLLMELGAAGEGLFLAPTIMEAEIARRYGVVVAGRLPDLREQFYAISGDRRIEHPAVALICSTARHGVLRGGLPSPWRENTRNVPSSRKVRGRPPAP